MYIFLKHIINVTDFLETVANFDFYCHIHVQRLEINKKWLLLPQKHNDSKNLLSSVISPQSLSPCSVHYETEILCVESTEFNNLAFRHLGC